MTREEMDALVLDAMSVPPTEDWHYPLAPNQLGRLIKLVADAERERIGKDRQVAKVRVLKALGDSSMSVQEIMAATGMSLTATRDIVYKMKKLGMLKREGPFPIPDGGIQYTYKATR